MFKQLVLAVSLSVITAGAGLCQGVNQSAGDTGQMGYDRDNAQTQVPYDHQNTPGWHGNEERANNGWADMTRTNGVGPASKTNIPEDVAPFDAGVSSYQALGGRSNMDDSGATTAAPYVGTYIAPGSFALRQQKLRKLPQTRLDSFVAQSGWNDDIYGDEGTWGPPPYDSFTWDRRIERGITSGGLTTGHRSDAPSAWDYPN